MRSDPVCECGATELAIIGTSSRDDGRFDLHTECGCGKTATFIGCAISALSYPPRADEAIVDQPPLSDPPPSVP